MIESEALQRKQRSIELLKKYEVPYIEHLPIIETSDEVQIKDKEAIAKRAVCVLLTIQFAYDQINNYNVDESHQLFYGILKDWNLTSELTNDEKAIFACQADEDKLCSITWKYEAYWVLIWALGFVESLDYPDCACDVEYAIAIVSELESFDELLKGINMRSDQEILDQADLIFRYDWACVEARLRGQEAPARLNTDVVIERHMALNWLIGYDDDWDHVSIDT